MACWTMVRVTLDDTRINRKARKALGLPVEGTLTVDQARRVADEAKVLTTYDKVKRLQPTAIITRKGNKLTVKVTV